MPETQKNRAPEREQNQRRRQRGRWGPICPRGRTLDNRTEDEMMRMEGRHLEGLADPRAVGRDLLGGGRDLPRVIPQLLLPHRVTAA